MCMAIESYAMASHFKEQIDKLTAIINAAAGRKHTEKTCSHLYEPQQSKITMQDRQYQRLGEMVLKMHDGRLEDRCISRFGKWLQSDEKALKYYIEFIQISAMLRYFYGNKQNPLNEELSLTGN